MKKLGRKPFFFLLASHQVLLSSSQHFVQYKTDTDCHKAEKPWDKQFGMLTDGSTSNSLSQMRFSTVPMPILPVAIDSPDASQDAKAVAL
jgi:hypothetical protein